MSEPPIDVTAAEAEAADWFARLGTPAVSAAALEDFRVWRRRPENAAAYRRLETVWAEAGGIRDDPDIRRALAAAAASRSGLRRSLRGRTLGPAAIGGAAACLVLVTAFWWQNRGALSTGVGEQELVQLKDGSSVRLDTDSRVRVRFGDRNRRVVLEQGRALFTVAPDPSRPFVVDAGPARVTAIGTAFDVRRDRGFVTVTLLSGEVRVDSPAGAGPPPGRSLAPGQQMIVTAAGRETRPVDLAAQTSWTQGLLVFRDTPLGAAVDEVNRYLTARIELDAARLESVAVNGVFRTGDGDAFVAAASDLFGLQAARSPDGSVTLKAPENKSRQAPGSPRG